MSDKWIKIANIVAEHGKENLVFMVPMRPLNVFPALGVAWTDSSDEEVIVEAMIDEDRYKVADHHKITLRAKNPNFGYEHFYQMDLENIIRDGRITYRVLNKAE